jgi:hypothetical protein
MGNFVVTGVTIKLIWFYVDGAWQTIRSCVMTLNLVHDLFAIFIIGVSFNFIFYLYLAFYKLQILSLWAVHTL